MARNGKGVYSWSFEEGMDSVLPNSTTGKNVSEWYIVASSIAVVYAVVYNTKSQKIRVVWRELEAEVLRLVIQNNSYPGCLGDVREGYHLDVWTWRFWTRGGSDSDEIWIEFWRLWNQECKTRFKSLTDRSRATSYRRQSLKSSVVVGRILYWT